MHFKFFMGVATLLHVLKMEDICWRTCSKNVLQRISSFFLNVAIASRVDVIIAWAENVINSSCKCTH